MMRRTDDVPVSSRAMAKPAEHMNPAAASATPACRSRRVIMRFLLIALCTLAGDLALKWYAFAHVPPSPVDSEALRTFGDAAIPPHAAITVVPYVLSLKLTVNHGAVFGLGQGGRWVFIVIALVACAVIARVFCTSRARDWKLHTALALVTGGALGNLYDRFVYGMVRDMLFAFPQTNLPFGWSWPDGGTLIYPWIFNFADAALVVGIGAIVLGILFGKHDHHSSPRMNRKDTSNS